MTISILLLFIFIILLLGVLPAWPYSSSWGYTPTSIFIVLVIVLLGWSLVEGRPFFRSTGQDIKTTIQNVGQDTKDVGRDAADSLRKAVQ